MVITDILHPLTQGNGLNFWSGIGSDLGELPLLAGLYVVYRKHACHVKRCYRIQWHEHPYTGHPVCRHHHPHDYKDVT